MQVYASSWNNFLRLDDAKKSEIIILSFCVIIIEVSWIFGAMQVIIQFICQIPIVL